MSFENRTMGIQIRAIFAQVNGYIYNIGAINKGKNIVKIKLSLIPCSKCSSPYIICCYHSVLQLSLLVHIHSGNI